MIRRALWKQGVVGAAAAFALGLNSAVAQPTPGAFSSSIRKAVERAGSAVVTVRPIGIIEDVPIVELPLAVPDQVRALIPRRVRRPVIGGIATAGSGVVVDAERGGIATCDHMLGGASRAVVVLPDGRERTSTAIRRDPETDLALIVIDPKGLNLTAAAFAEPPGLALGDWVVAIGRPAGQAVTLSAGLGGALRDGVSANRLEALIEADVRISEVNRGGALVDLDGGLRGVLTDRVPNGLEGQGYAIPGEIVKRVVHDLGELGYVRRAYLGVQLGFMESRDGRGSRPAGVLVQSVANPGPAAAAGLRPGDLITAVAGKPVSSPGAIRRLVELAPIGEPLAVLATRGDARLELSVKPEEQPRELGAPRQAPLVEAAPRTRIRPGQRPPPPAQPPASSRVQRGGDVELDPIPDSKTTPPRPAPPPQSR